LTGPTPIAEKGSGIRTLISLRAVTFLMNFAEIPLDGKEENQWSQPYKRQWELGGIETLSKNGAIYVKTKKDLGFTDCNDPKSREFLAGTAGVRAH